MLVNCVICSDLFTHGDDVSATPCGHVFHFSCLMQWMERSQSCPQCRTKTTEKKLCKLYFNVALGETVEDPGSLQNQIESLKFKLRCKDVDIKNAEEKAATMNTHNQGLRDECVKLEKDVKQNKKTISALKEQVVYLQKQEKEAKEVREECRNLRRQLAELQSVEMVVSGTTAEVEEMLSSYVESSDVAARSSLATYCVMLKRELHSTMEKKRATRNEIRALQQEASHLESQLKNTTDKLEREQAHVRNLSEDLVRSETENESLLRKVRKLERAMLSPSGDPKTSAIKRIICESPCPEKFKKPRLSDPAFDETFMQPNETTESPYLNIKSSSVGLTPLRPSVKENKQKFFSQGIANQKFSIFKKARLPLPSTTTVPEAEEAYNGLGGHSKSDLFPTPLPRPSFSKKPRKVSKLVKAATVPNLQKYFSTSEVIDAD